MGLLDEAKVFQEINQADLAAEAAEAEKLAQELANAASRRADILKKAIVAAGVDASNITVEDTAGTAYVSVGMPEIGQEKIVEFEIQPTDESTVIFVRLHSNGAEPVNTASLALYADDLPKRVETILIPHVARLIPVTPVPTPAVPPAETGKKTTTRIPYGSKVVTDVVTTAPETAPEVNTDK